MALLGVTAMGEQWVGPNQSTQFPYQSAGLNPTRVDSGPHDGLGAYYGSGLGDSWYDIYDAIGGTADKVWYYFCFKGVSVGDVASTHAIAYFHHTIGTTTGACRLVVSTYIDVGSGADATKINFMPQYYSGAAWTTANSSQGATQTLTDEMHLCVEVDFGAATPIATLYINNSANSSTEFGGNAPVVTGTFCLLSRPNSKDALNWNGYEHFANDDDGAAPNTRYAYVTANTSGAHVFGNVPQSDVNAVWTAVGNEGNGSTDRWRAVDAAYDDAPQDNDRITMEGDGATHNQGFTLWTQDDGSAAIYGVAVYVLGFVSDLLGYCTTESSTPTNGGATMTSVHATGNGFYIFWPTTPGNLGGSAWTPALFNSLRVYTNQGEPSGTAIVNHVVVSSLGIYQDQPDNATACPVSAFVPRVMVI